MPDYIRRGLGEYVVMSESNFYAGPDQVRDKLKEVQQALGKPGEGGKGGAEDNGCAAEPRQPGKPPADASAG
ncbi:MAG: hypothetical protein WDO73_15565 [Ignavibacteriota bacterium]